MTPDDVSNYETYTAAYAAVQSWLDLVDEVKALADALPQEITFNDEQDCPRLPRKPMPSWWRRTWPSWRMPKP